MVRVEILSTKGIRAVSLEAIIAALTEAVKANTEVVIKHTAYVESATAKFEAVGAGGGKKTEAAPAETRQISEQPETRTEPPATEEHPPAVAAMVAFMDAAASPEERAERKKEVTTLFGKLKVGRASEIKEADVPRFQKALKTLSETKFAPKADDNNDDLV